MATTPQDTAPPQDITHKIYDERDGPMSTSIATRCFQTKVQEADLVMMKEEDDGWEKIGLVISVSGQDEEEADDELTVPDGKAKVWWMEPETWPSDEPTVHDIADLTVLDRAFCKGVAVAPTATPARQGVVQDIDLTLKIKVLSFPEKEALIHSTQLSKAHPFISDIITIKTPDMPSPLFCAQRRVHIDVLLKFPDNSYCVIQDATSAGWLKNETPMMTVPRGCPDTFFYPGQTVSCARAIKNHSKYIVGKWKKTHRKAMVVRVIPVAIQARILAGTEASLEKLPRNTDEKEENEATQAETDSEDEDADTDGAFGMGYSSEEDFMDDGGASLLDIAVHPSFVYSVDFVHENLEFGDAGIVSEELIAALREKAANEESDVVNLVEAGDASAPCPRYFPPLSDKQNPIVMGTDIKNYPKGSQRTRRAMYKNALKSKKNWAMMETDCKRAAVVTGTFMKVKILWQDGTVSGWEDAKDFHTLHHTQEFEHFPMEFVKPASDFMKDTVGQSTEVTTVSCYDLAPAIDCFGVGDMVAHCPRNAETLSLVAPPAEVLTSTWSCQICTLINPKSHPHCNACQGPRPKGVSDNNIATSGIEFDGTILHFAGCGGTPVLNPNDENPSKACVGVVQEVDPRGRVAKVNWIRLPKNLIQENPRPTKGNDTFVPITGSSLSIGTVMAVGGNGEITVRWHRHGDADTTEIPPITLPVTDLVLLDYSSDDLDTGSVSDHDYQPQFFASTGTTTTVDQNSPSTNRTLLSWGKDLVQGFTNMMRGRKAQEGAGESDDDEEPGFKAKSEQTKQGEEEEEEEDADECFKVINCFTEHAYLTTLGGCFDMKRVQKEWKSFHRSLPEGIRVIASETQPHLLQALIDGPMYTPYRNSPFVFNLLLPPQFPEGPPTANFHSIGLRLNPNLYANGHICLSLLGTWAGYQQCETWNESSTLLQVLISIQALVLTKEPYYNEAGYHNHLGTTEGRQNSRAYNEQIYLLVLRYLTLLMKQTPLHFAKEIRAFVEKNWKGIVERAEGYLNVIEPEEHSVSVEVPMGDKDKEDEEASHGAKEVQDKKMVTQEELEKHSNYLNEDGLILPASAGFSVSLRTSVLPQLRLALQEQGFAPKE